MNLIPALWRCLGWLSTFLRNALTKTSPTKPRLVTLQVDEETGVKRHNDDELRGEIKTLQWVLNQPQIIKQEIQAEETTKGKAPAPTT